MSLLLSIPNVVGESTQRGFVGAVQAESVSWGHGRLTDPTTGLPRGVVLPRLFRVEKSVDRASPSIAALLIGRKSVKLEFFHTDPVTGSVLTRAILDGAVFEEMRTAGSNASGNPHELLTASYGRITVLYSRLVGPGGAVQLVGSYVYSPAV